jgi:hypothetical protein
MGRIYSPIAAAPPLSLVAGEMAPLARGAVRGLHL